MNKIIISIIVIALIAVGFFILPKKQDVKKFDPIATDIQKKQETTKPVEKEKLEPTSDESSLSGVDEYVNNLSDEEILPATETMRTCMQESIHQI